MTESLRTLDRLRLRAKLPDGEIASRRSTIIRLIESLELVEIDTVVLDRAAQPMPTDLDTLDAIHLATALLWKELSRTDVIMATHDGALGLAAQAHGLRVHGEFQTSVAYVAILVGSGRARSGRPVSASAGEAAIRRPAATKSQVGRDA